jgi:Uri superfamily endonuclease
VKGIYVLIIKVTPQASLKIGALGQIIFHDNLYAYVGSAQGSIESRVKRHLRKEKQLFWHIDYLLTNDSAKIIQIYYYSTSDKTGECQMAQLIAKHSKVIPNFGCSDCHCKSHLFYSDNFDFLKDHMKQLTLQKP